MADSLDRLYKSVLALTKEGDPSRSRTARLIQAGRAKAAKKLAEEAVEVVIDAMQGDRPAVIRESADLLYHVVVLWASLGVKPEDVWAEMNRREQLFGLAEKLPKDGQAEKLPKDLPTEPARRKVIALESRRVPKRR